MSESEFVVVGINDLRQLTGLRQKTYGVTSIDGDDNPNTRHFAMFRIRGNVLSGGAVACASFTSNLFQNEPTWELRGFAVDSEFGGRRVAKELLAGAEGKLSNYGIKFFLCYAKLEDVPILEACGWSQCGPPGILQKMIRRIP